MAAKGAKKSAMAPCLANSLNPARAGCYYTKHSRTLSPTKDIRNERENSELRAVLTELDHIVPQVANTQKQVIYMNS